MKTPLIFITLSLSISAVTTLCRAADIDQYNVVWNSPSRNALGSMPIGNGDIGANVWVEPSGDLVLLLSKTDAWDGNGRLLKLGRVRIQADPPLFKAGGKFEQTLDLQTGTIRVDTSTTGITHRVSVWIDANQPVIHVEVEGDEPVKVTVQHESWRKARRKIGGGEVNGAYGAISWPDGLWCEPDIVFEKQQNRIAFAYRNTTSVWKDTLRVQALEDSAATGGDPLMNRTFGAIVEGNGLINDGDACLVSKIPSTSCAIAITSYTAVTATTEEWLSQATALASTVSEESLNKARAAHAAWWAAFWDRSWIHVSGKSTITLPTNDKNWRVGVDSQGHNRFGGKITGPRVVGRALSSEEVAALAAMEPASKTELVKEEPGGGCSVAAWIKPSGRESGRILETVAATSPHGYLFDTFPGLSLRWAVERNVLTQRDCLKPGVWQHVAGTVDAASGIMRLYVNGKLVNEAHGAGAGKTAETVTRGYALQRWINACGGRGNMPIKFNGSIFNVDVLRPINKQGPFNADYRAWGGCYWWQNTRLPYWSMLAAGDFDMMKPLFKMYRDALPLRKAATRKYYQHEGAYFPETMYFWGTWNNDNYGWNRKGKPDGLSDNQYIRYEWQAGIELTAMMLDYYDRTHDTTFLKETLLPVASEIITFYDQHWPRGEDGPPAPGGSGVAGKIRMHPAQALETWWNCVNPMPEVAGLHWVLPRLIALTDDSARKAAWGKTLQDLPAVPTRETNGKRYLTPAETFAKHHNSETPELYAVFPYGLYGIDKPNLEVGLETWRRQNRNRTGGWVQNAIWAAKLGQTDDAKRLVSANFHATARGFRFPAFWGPNYDWVPDQDHGGVAMIALQSMLMQTDPASPEDGGGADKILLLPAWPTEWNVSFKLHAPQNTTVEGVYHDGKMLELKVTPESRRKDIIVQSQASLKEKKP